MVLESEESKTHRQKEKNSDRCAREASNMKTNRGNREGKALEGREDKSKRMTQQKHQKCE